MRLVLIENNAPLRVLGAVAFYVVPRADYLYGTQTLSSYLRNRCEGCLQLVYLREGDKPGQRTLWVESTPWRMLCESL